MKLFILLVLICLSNPSCMYRGCTQGFATTLTVLDMSGKPIKGRKVKALKSFSSFFGSLSSSDQLLTTAITDANGQALLRYNLSISDSSQDFCVLTAEDDALLKTVKVATHTLGNTCGSIKKLTETIQMDSLVPFKIRFKTSRDDVKSFQVNVTNDPSLMQPQNFNFIKRIFIDSSINTTTPKLDTIINTLVYSKADFMMWNSMSFKNAPVFISKGLTLMKSDVNRNLVFLQEF
jgi:hypothetical protein